MAIDGRGTGISAGMEPAIKTQIVAVGAGSLASVAFTSATKFVRLHTDTNCNLVFGDSTATAVKDVSMRMPANQTEFWGVRPGAYVAVIAGT